MTIYDFAKQNRVEVTMNPDGTYSCYINYTQGDKAWGVGSNCFDAIDNGVIAYLNSRTVPPPPPLTQDQIKKENDAVRLFLSKDALFIWYFFARKYGIRKIIDYYERLAMDTNPTYLNVMRFLYTKVNEVIENPATKIVEGYEAINNVFIQALVFYESLKIERYENNKIISDMITKLSPSDNEAFYKIQETIKNVDIEIQKIPEDEE